LNEETTNRQGGILEVLPKALLRWSRKLTPLFLSSLVALVLNTSVFAQLSDLEFELPNDTKIDGYRLAFTCGSLVRRIDGELDSVKIHGFAVSRMVQDSVSQEEGQKLIREAGAFSNYIVKYYASNHSELNLTKKELCFQAKVLLPGLPLSHLN